MLAFGSEKFAAAKNMLYLCIEEVRTDLYGNLWHKVLSTMTENAMTERLEPKRVKGKNSC